ncbi:MAG TPA: glycine betaine ABC transporter substrate-binding protein [Acidimicrobiales bacterium]|nr:glycine betaine ABC transporter substrate-binding protein [Acidimicrobiales bacterium]
MSRNRWRRALALTLSVGLVGALAACGDDDDSEGTTDDTTAVEGSTIRIAPQDFNEAKVLTEVYAQYLEAEGFEVDLQAPNGFRDQVYPDLENDDLDLIIDYTGSAVLFLNPDADPPSDADEAHAALQAELSGRGLTAANYAQAEDKNALVALKTFTDENQITNISDLAKLGTVNLVGAEDCRNRIDCLLGYTDPAIYGLDVDFTAVAYGPPLVEALDAGTAHVAQYGSTAPEVASGKLVVLTDDKGILTADNVVPVLRSEIAEEYDGALTAALDDLSALITTEDLLEWAVATDVDLEEPADIATAWLEEKDLI